MRHNEIMRAVFSMDNEEASKQIRKEAFTFGDNTEEERDSRFQMQSLFIEDVRKAMKEKESLAGLKDYADNKFAIIPSKANELEYLLVIFDLDINKYPGMLAVRYDKEIDKFYILEEDESPIE